MRTMVEGTLTMHGGKTKWPWIQWVSGRLTEEEEAKAEAKRIVEATSFHDEGSVIVISVCMGKPGEVCKRCGYVHEDC